MLQAIILASLSLVICTGIDGQHEEQILTVADHHACIIEQTSDSEASGAIVCWGENDELELEAPAGLFVQISAAAHHACAVTEQGQVRCWGAEATSGSLQPPDLDDVFSQVAVAEHHVCALTQAGRPMCWGRNTYGEASPPSLVFSTLSCSGKHSCGITTSGDLLCWGGRVVGMPPSPPGAFTALSASSAGHVCAIDVFSRLHCWGAMIGPKGGHEVWNETFVAVSAGRMVTCAVKGNGALLCLGAVSRLWMSGVPDTTEPFSEASAGDAALCGITATDSAVRCWGPRQSLMSVPEDLVPLGYGDVGAVHTKHMDDAEL